MRNLLKVFIAGIASAAFQLSLNAAPYTLEDFAHSAELAKATTSLREVDLSLSIYESMQRKDYGDIRVFSADGQLVPYQLSHSETVNSHQSKPLTFYPFTKEQASNKSNFKVIIDQIQRSENQTMKITQKWSGDFYNTQRLKEYQYIIENPQTKPSLCKLQLDWVQDQASMVLPLKLESSNNLQNWSSLSRKKSVSKLSYAGSNLVQDEVSFSCTTNKYLRLTWLKPSLQVHLQNIKGLYTKSDRPQTEWKSFGKPRSDKDNNWLFESDVIAGISQMEFVPPQEGIFYKGILYSRNSEKDQWRYINNVSQYRLNIGDTELKSNAFSITENQSRYWKLELQSESHFTEEQLPQIRAGWSPRKLLFLAQGKGPFRLAYGNPNIKPAEQNDLNSLVKTIHDTGSSIDNVKLGKIENSGKIFSPQTPWKLIIFWALLILGTMLMAYMAFKLLKQMGEK